NKRVKIDGSDLDERVNGKGVNIAVISDALFEPDSSRLSPARCNELTNSRGSALIASDSQTDIPVIANCTTDDNVAGLYGAVKIQHASFSSHILDRGLLDIAEVPYPDGPAILEVMH